MVTDGRWWGKAHTLMIRAQGISPSYIAQHAWSARVVAEQLDGKATADNVAQLAGHLQQLDAAVGAYRAQWVAFQYEVERLRRDVEVYSRELADQPEVPQTPDATWQLLEDVHRSIDILTEEAHRRSKR